MSKSGLKPQNIVQAAVADMERRERNEARAVSKYFEVYEPYAFHRSHVKIADGPFGLIQLAIDADAEMLEKIRKSNKSVMRHIYFDRELLLEAMTMEKRKNARDTAD